MENTPLRANKRLESPVSPVQYLFQYGLNILRGGLLNQLTKIFVILASIHAGLAVVIGAFGAHALKERLTGQMLATFQTGVNYHFLGCLLSPSLHHKHPDPAS
jgi:hypothetical protein